MVLIGHACCGRVDGSRVLVGKTSRFDAGPDISVDEDVEDGIDETVEVGQGHQVHQKHGVIFQ